MTCWPNLFLLAAPRSGSSQLAAWLASHPEIALPPIKEPNFFAHHEFPPPDDPLSRNLLDVRNPGAPRARGTFALVTRAQDYNSLYARLVAHRWRLDASTSYLACPDAPAAIAQTCPDACIITVTRAPIARAWSHYGLARRTGRTTASLTDEISRELADTGPPGLRYLLRPSRQRDAIARVATIFPPSCRLHLTFEEMIANPPAVLRTIASFLDIDPTGFDMARTARNASALPRFAALTAALHHTGWHAPLRRALPSRAKTALRPIWFRKGSPQITEAEHHLLFRHLEGA